MIKFGKILTNNYIIIANSFKHSDIAAKLQFPWCDILDFMPSLLLFRNA